MLGEYFTWQRPTKIHHTKVCTQGLRVASKPKTRADNPTNQPQLNRVVAMITKCDVTAQTTGEQ